ncbi:unnamed protein product [Rotaria sp. Silwood2]|nr:unnamed protein product [Rotaria sp. Silwood2]CAF2503198.1 unnamed protein product [Rotaria sp. Silwood2]CAF2901140.1 unnamed protein product [Rotaria sp. Silwood2]CAF4123629.1 unnamed protein product [Rotaria sp. Silwood2]CAF4320681.1 unnamed protein product [Rotaria sp. Silwood2]
MCSSPVFLPDLAAFLNRLTNEERHQIGRTLIQQSQGSVQKQQHKLDTPCPSLLALQRPPSSYSPQQQTNSPIPPLMNHHKQTRLQVRPLMEQLEIIPGTTSTPRRPISDSFDNSNSNLQHASKRPRKNEQSPHYQQPVQQQPTIALPQSRFSFNINMLKRAVNNNLPCFFISFDLVIDRIDIPSCTQVAIMLKKLFVVHHLSIKELSLCGPADDRRFKFAVNDKIDFLTLFNWSWPDELDGK